jgi:hypothetical protein
MIPPKATLAASALFGVASAYNSRIVMIAALRGSSGLPFAQLRSI